ncbi:MAG: response regulator [Candidatus Omnitrophica bacterium]|nr:response regulator [Candidatus Omnitrophota bacterium]
MGKKVLIVDDDRVGLALMTARISKEGFTVLTAANGKVGLECAIKEKPGLIVLDIEMPEMNGYTFVLEMKQQEALKDIPVIVTTAHEENRPIFARRGIKHYLVKPVQMDELIGKIVELIGPA